MNEERQVKYLLVEPSGEISLKQSVLSVLKVQEIVGGDFEVMPTPTDINVTVIVAEDAKKRGENANWAITRLLRSRLRPDDFVAGRGIVTGPPDAAGEPTDLEQDVETAIRAKVEVK